MDVDSNKKLGTLCKHGHDHNGTGKSLRYKIGRCCIECSNLRAIKYKKNGSKSQTQSAYYARNKEATLEYQRQHRAKNRERLNARDRLFYQEKGEARKAYLKKYKADNRERIQARDRLYRSNNKESRNDYQRKYMKQQRDNNTPMVIASVLRGKVMQAFKRYTKNGKIMTSAKYGIDYKGIIAHLGPHPNALGREGDFHIDHIIPVSAFDLTDLEQVKIAFAPENHQWLTAHENQVKSATLPSPDTVPTEILAMLEDHNIGIMANG